MFRCLPAMLLLALLGGCLPQNRYSTYGSDIFVYEGDADVLSNCCFSAISLLAEDLKAENRSDLCPAMHAIAKKTSGSDGKSDAVRRTFTLTADEVVYRINVAQVNGCSTLILDSHNGDIRLRNHLIQLFLNFRVRPDEIN